ncbi:unnamed protein product [Rotaria magnacalcarata]|uniref:Uncharacterized protein n=1 Tax=Rotaria magnacalcarata TaxID=392030 RepID=A0A820C7A3_9BILA|nr:unnamed protein product [Rotaria magnacalcarata]
MEHYILIDRLEITISDRQCFINTDAVIHNQLSIPQFTNLIQNGFIQAGVTNATVGQIEKPEDVSLEFSDLYCSTSNCNERTLLIYAWCRKALCYYHLIEQLHLHL